MLKLSFAIAFAFRHNTPREHACYRLLAGADDKFVEATAMIEGSTVVVSVESVSKPKTVQFGWHKVANPNLINGAGLPASPFQTKKWIGGTGEE